MKLPFKVNYVFNARNAKYTANGNVYPKMIVIAHVLLLYAMHTMHIK